MKPRLDPVTAAVFQRALRAMLAEEVPFVVAGAFAVNHYCGTWRDTKDLDLFVRPDHAVAALAVLGRAGFQTRVIERHWLGKAEREHLVVDVIWGGGNWVTSVDDHWFAHAEPGDVLGIEVPIAPAEDIILSKAYVAGRERFDGADITHLIRARGDRFDWHHVVARFGPHWAVLLHYMVLYRFVYPDARERAPIAIIRQLAGRLGTDEEVADGLPFRGLLLDRYAYLHDIRYEGRADPGVPIAERAGFTAEEVRRRRHEDARALDAGLVYRPHDQLNGGGSTSIKRPRPRRSRAPGTVRKAEG